MEAKDNPLDSRDSAGPRNADSPYHLYQLDYLLNELEYSQRRSNVAIWRTSRLLGVEFLSVHLRQFYWTVTRLIGLGYLHDGSRAAIQYARFPRPAVARCPGKMQPGPRVLVDCTETHRNGFNTGIQRVVREVAKAAIAEGSALPVIIEKGRLLSYFRRPDLADEVAIGKGDRFLLLDSSWNSLDEHIPIMQEVSLQGGTNICCIYDLIPVLYPGMVATRARETFLGWLKACLPSCDAVVTISKSVAEDFINYVSANELPRKPSLRVGWFHLGADFSTDVVETPSQRVQDICRATPFFLTVGTLEPRKNHAVALAAFDLVWKAGIDAKYVIFGEFGWLAYAMRERITRHPEFGRRLFWLEGGDDAELRYLYRHTAALIHPSVTEGFGLPIIEAAHFEAPVIASDIRIFREIGGEAISYFDPMDPDALARLIKEALTAPRTAASINALSWKEATERLLKLVKEETYLFRVDPVRPT